MLRRRRFLALTGAASIAQWPLMAHAQKQHEAAIGIITLGSRDILIRTVYFPRFLAGLAELGFVEGRNTRFEWGVAEGHYDRLPALAAGLVDKRVTVIA